MFLGLTVACSLGVAATFKYTGVVDNSIASGPIATTAFAATGDAVLYTVVLPDSVLRNEPFAGLFQYTPVSTTIKVGGQTYSSGSSIYTGFYSYSNPAIGIYNGIGLQDTYGGNLFDGQFALYNLINSQTTNEIGILQSSGVIPPPGANPFGVGYNVGILHFVDSQTPQDHTYWYITDYSVSFDATAPEPASIVLCGVGVALLAGAARLRTISPK